MPTLTSALRSSGRARTADKKTAPMHQSPNLRIEAA